MRAPKRRPRRVSLRSRSGDSSILSVMHRIQERDVQILLDLHEHRVLTTQQIAELHFPSYHVGWKRLHLLEQLGFVRHFQPAFWHGSAPHHFVLDEPGALLVAVRLDTDLKSLGWKPDDAIRIARSQTRDHLVQANGFFTRLAWRARTSGRAELTEWIGERRASRGWGVAIQPDGVGRVTAEASDVWFFFELDRGTETHGQLRAKLRRYSEVALLPDVPWTVLFAFPTERREAEARKALRVPGMNVATTVLELAMDDPIASIWLPLGYPIRVPLFDLAPRSSDPDQPDQHSLGERGDRLAVEGRYARTRPLPPREPP